MRARPANALCFATAASFIALVTVALLAASAHATGGRPQITFTVNADDDAPSDACDARHCNLREAIEAANAYQGRALIRFAIGAAPVLIQPLSALPPLTGDVHLDGATQPGTACPLPVVRIDGSMLPRQNPQVPVPDDNIDGLVMHGDGNSVRGVIVSQFPGDGIVVRGDRNVVQCSFVGTDETGMQAAGNGGHGIVVDTGVLNRIGGPDRAQGNLISANGGIGLRLRDALGTEEHFNYIGVDLFEEPTLPNGNDEALGEPPPPSALPPAAAARLAMLIERKAESIADQYPDALARSGIFDRYLALLGPNTPNLPANLFELWNLLASRPDLYAPFVREVAGVIDREDRRAAHQLDASRRRFARSPSFLKEAAPYDLLRPLSELVEAIDPDDVVISGPELTMAIFRGDLPILPAAPFPFATFRTFGPVDFSSVIGTAIDGVCTGPVPCEWPIVYDLKPRVVMLTWDTDFFTDQEVTDIVQQDDFLFGLYLNGNLLSRGTEAQVQAFTHIYWAAKLPAHECPDPTRRCIAMEVRTRDSVVAGNALPWTFELRIERIEDLAIPEIIGIDEFGNPIVATQEAVTVNRSFKTFNPNDTNDESWFVAAMEETFRSDRCVDCHQFSTFEPLAAHHGYSDVAAFVEDLNVHLEPSLFVPGKHVITCVNCHNLPYTDPHGIAFHEIEWRTPFVDLDVDWSAKTVEQVCARVKQNLTTSSARYLHFHGDARLFWAVEDPTIAGITVLNPPAEPQDYDEFLRRFDLWNLGGAPCP